jgi:hypothetical protein
VGKGVEDGAWNTRSHCQCNSQPCLQFHLHFFSALSSYPHSPQITSAVYLSACCVFSLDWLPACPPTSTTILSNFLNNSASTLTLNNTAIDQFSHLHFHFAVSPSPQPCFCSRSPLPHIALPASNDNPHPSHPIHHPSTHSNHPNQPSAPVSYH